MKNHHTVFCANKNSHKVVERITIFNIYHRDVNSLEKPWTCHLKQFLVAFFLLTSFFLSHCAVKVPDTVWIEPAILWISIVMPTGSGKTPLFNYLTGILQRVREKLKIPKMHPPWLLDEASFEKMGELMATNHSKLLAMYDELSSYLAQINVYRGKGLSDSHDLSTFLSLYNGKSWTRATGKSIKTL